MTDAFALRDALLALQTHIKSKVIALKMSELVGLGEYSTVGEISYDDYGVYVELQRLSWEECRAVHIPWVSINDIEKYLDEQLLEKPQKEAEKKRLAEEAELRKAEEAVRWQEDYDKKEWERLKKKFGGVRE